MDPLVKNGLLIIGLRFHPKRSKFGTIIRLMGHFLPAPENVKIVIFRNFLILFFMYDADILHSSFCSQIRI